MPQISLVAAFMAGFLSFLSPCVLPLIPAYISFVAGISAKELESSDSKKTKSVFNITTNCLFFVIGLSTVFILLGASASAFGGFLLQNRRLLEILAGIIVILFGLHLTHILRFKVLEYEKRVHLKHKPRGIIGSFLVGMAFALGWTPCIGPILGGILTYAATQETIYQGMLLLALYSLGLGIPFIITGLTVNSFFLWFDKIKKHLLLIERISGVFLILVGILMLTNRFQQLTNFFVLNF